jgi:uncharacterized protein (DUF1499 family)
LESEFSVSLKDWLAKNLYVTSPKNEDPFFHPRRYSKTKEQVAPEVHRAISSLKGWRVEEYRENQGRIHATHRGLFPVFVEEVNVYIVQGLDGVTKLEVTSHSRTGKGDWGQNKRNIRRLLTALDVVLPPL